MDEYLKDVCINIKYLISKYIEVIDNKETIERILHKNDINGYGQVCNDDIDDVLQNGNIREMMTLVYNFGLQGHHIIMSMIINKSFRDCLDSNIIDFVNLDNRLTRLKLLIGITDDNILQKIIKDMGNKDMLPSMFASFVKDGPVLASKTKEEIPFIEETRTKTNYHNAHNRHIPFIQYSKNTIYPELSKREKRWFNLHGYDEDNIPWISGCEYYKINQKCFYKKLADNFHQKTLTGLSGTTDLVMDIMTLFTSFNADNATYSCIIWMCCGSVVDHTVFEVLIASIPYNSGYSVDKDALEYCKEKQWIIYNYDDKAHNYKIVEEKIFRFLHKNKMLTKL